MTGEQPPSGKGPRRPRRLALVDTAGTDQAPVPAVPRPSRRNTAADREFIKSAAQQGQIRVVDGRIAWTGRSADLLNPYQAAPDERRCVHSRTVKDDHGKALLDAENDLLRMRCPKWAMLGTNLCVDHAMGSKAVMDEARQMISGAALALVGKLIQKALDDDEPTSEQIKAINSLLDRFGLRGGIEVGPDMPAWREIMQELGKETGVTE